MAIIPSTTPTESAADIFAEQKRVEMTQQKTWKFGQASAEATLETCTPVGFNETTGEAAEWMAPDPTVIVVDIDGSTGGTWGLTINGIVIANTIFADDATAALVQSTILASTGIKASVALAAGVYTITFDDEPEIKALPTVTGDVTQLTGGDTPTATPTAGTATVGTHIIKGIVWPEPITVSDSGEVLGVVMVAGNVDYNELVAVVASGDVAALKAACQTELLPRGLNVQNLAQVR